MAEFKEVIKQWVRLGTESCGYCPVSDLCSRHMEIGNECLCYDIETKADNMETMVMAWAAEHPEPVYPTLIEYLRGLGLEHHRMCDPIPADVARKLGLKPKEVENDG